MPGPVPGLSVTTIGPLASDTLPRLKLLDWSSANSDLIRNTAMHSSRAAAPSAAQHRDHSIPVSDITLLFQTFDPLNVKW